MPRRSRKYKGQKELFRPVKTLFGLAFEPAMRERKKRLLVFTEHDLLEKRLDKSKFIELKFFNPPTRFGPEKQHWGTSIFIPKKITPQRHARITESMRLVNEGLEKGTLKFSSGILNLVPPWQINPSIGIQKPELIKALYEVNALLKATWPEQVKTMSDTLYRKENK
ncbi:hypothetical protein HZB89_01335 [archaeon]|nr:hypothetical protein [archaeon]